MLYRRISSVLLPAVVAFAASACSSGGDIAPYELRLAQTAIQEAKQLDAERFAGPVLREAEERFDLARNLAQEGREEEALRKLQEAQVLARRAEAESLAQQTAHASEIVQESLSAMEDAVQAGGGDAAGRQRR